jgi:hypothetical protein
VKGLTDTPRGYRVDRCAATLLVVASAPRPEGLP